MAYNKSQKLQDNIAAIKLVLQLSKEGRTANDDERAVLRRYSGFGGLKFILNPAASDDDERHWKISDQQYFRPVRELYAIIHEYAADEKEERAIIDSVKRSVNTAFYTPDVIIDAIASAFKECGIEVRTMLDPSAGIGKFGDSFKQAYNGDIKVSAFEKDVLTGKILSALNPHDQITVDGFETIPDSQKGRFDLVTSNIPFGNFGVFDPAYNRSDNRVLRYAASTIHNYFFLKALDMTRDGGLVAFITSRGMMDSNSNITVRYAMMQQAHLVTAIRLPDGMFRDEAGTEVGSDLIILQKDANKEKNTLTSDEEAFVQNMVSDDDITVNAYYDSHSENIITTGMKVGTDAYGKPAYVFPWDKGLNVLSGTLAFRISNAIKLSQADERFVANAPKFEERKVEQPKPQIAQPASQSPQQPKPKAEQAQSAPVQLDLFAMWDEMDAGNGPSQEELAAQNAEREAQEAARREAERKRLEPRAWEGEQKEWYRDGTVVVEPDTPYVGVLSNGMFTPLANLTADQTGRLRQYILTRDAYHELYNTEAELREEQPDLREVLNRHYDNFHLRYGRLNERKNARLIMMDALGRDSLTLENEGENRDFVKADIFERPVSFISYEITHVDTPEEALSASLNRYGKANLEYMAALTGHKQEEMPELLKGQIYYMPDGSYEIASKALSGNVYEKLAYVSEALDMMKAQEPGDDIDASIIPALEDTKAALTAVIPEQIAFDDIGLQFGERWIPTEYYEEYISKLFDTKIEIHYAEHIDEYSLKAENRYNLKIREEYCIHGEYKDYDGMALLSHAFHNTTPDIQKCVGFDDNGDDLKGPDMEKIQLANTKIEEIRDGFTEYLTNLPKEKRDELQEMYNRKFNCFVKAKYDGSYQTFPGIDLKALASPKFNIKNIYKSQKDCVKMILENGGGICDHEVGTGKSLIMCMAAHEMHRLGIANKPMIIAMKANVAEIAATYQAAFPNDKLLYASEKDFSPANRVQFFNRIKNNDYACVIMSHDQFGKIPQAMEVQEQILRDEIRDLDEALDVIRQQGGNISRRMLTGLEKRKENMEVKLMELQSDMANRKDDFVDFGRMGIDHIFIDESHQFKNLMFTTRHQRVSGLGNPSGSQKALNLLYAIRTIQNRTGKDLGATFLSGTTISNSLTELYLLFKYLRPDAMAKQGIHSFDAWAAVYAKKTSDYEFSVTNSVVQKERFRYFVKVPELATFYNEITDYRTGEDVGLDRPNMNVILHDIEPTADQKDFNERLVQFAQNGDGELIFRAPLSDSEMKGKMLIATDASRKASLDMRLISPELFGDDPNNKASHCARLVSEYYQKFDEQRGTQFIFSDLSTYKPNEWNIFQEIKDKLVNDYGIPASEVRFIQEASSNNVKQKMIDLMNEGKIRVLFGSTSTLGTGVNAQQRAVAVHHIDIPWRPSDLEQRNGRARRTGNWVAKEFANNNVDVIIYAVKRTLDSYKFNLLQNKQLFITQLKTNQLGTRVIDEGAMDEENGMNFAEYVAILSGNDDLLQKAKFEKKILALESERKTYMQARRDTEWRLENAREKLGKNEIIINGMTEDYERYQSQVKQGEDGTPLPGLVLNNVSEFTADGAYNVEGMGAALQDAGRTVGNKDRQMGSVYGFPLMVDTIYMYDEKLKKEVYAGNKFYVKGNYLYEHNNGKLAMSKDNRLAAVRYGVNALEKIPGVIAQYQERNEKLRADIAEYERIAGKPWGKEEELKGLKKEMEALDAKIRENLDETVKTLPKQEEPAYKIFKEGKYHKVTFARDTLRFVSFEEMREAADTGSWRNHGYVTGYEWCGNHLISNSEIEGEFTQRQKAEEWIKAMIGLQKSRVDDKAWLEAKAAEDTAGYMIHQDNEVIFAARQRLAELNGEDYSLSLPDEVRQQLFELANKEDYHSDRYSKEKTQATEARKTLNDYGIDWHTNLSLDAVASLVEKWSAVPIEDLSEQVNATINRLDDMDQTKILVDERDFLSALNSYADKRFYNQEDRREALVRLGIYADYLCGIVDERVSDVQETAIEPTAKVVSLQPEETPIMKQFHDMKSKHPDALLLFRVGDFYESYEKDAQTAADVLGIALTWKNAGADFDTYKGALTTFPHHALDSYLPKLIRAGLRVAICDQLEDPKAVKKSVRRGITETVEPSIGVRMQVVARRSSLLPVEKSLMSQIVSDIETGNHLLGRQRPEGYWEFVAEHNDAVRALQDGEHLTDRQRDILLERADNYNGGIAELAEMLNMDEQQLRGALIIDRAKEQREEQNYNLFEDGLFWFVDSKVGFGLNSDYTRQVAKTYYGEPTERDGRTMMRFATRDDAVGFISQISMLNERHTNALRDGLIEKMRRAGIDVNTDWQEGEHVLSQVNGKTHEQLSVGYSQQEVEEKIGPRLTMKNYNDIRKINPFLSFLWSDKVPEFIDYREAFKTPSLDDYYVATKADFEYVGSESANHTEDLIAIEHENEHIWQEMVASGKYEHQKSPRSYSEYLIDHETGDIYRFSNHWGRVASCLWDIDKRYGTEDTEIYAIGKSNIKDFKPNYFQCKANNPAYGAPYIDALQRTISNYETLLNSNVEITDAVRRLINTRLESFRKLQALFNDNGYTESRYAVRLHQADEHSLSTVLAGDITRQDVERAMDSKLVKSWLKAKNSNDVAVRNGFDFFGVGPKLIHEFAKARLGITNRYEPGMNVFYNSWEALSDYINDAKANGLDAAIADKYNLSSGSDDVQHIMEHPDTIYSAEELAAIEKSMKPAAFADFQMVLRSFPESKQIQEEEQHIRQYNGGAALTKAFVLYDIAQRRLFTEHEGDERWFRQQRTWSRPDGSEGFKYVLKTDVANELMHLIATSSVTEKVPLLEAMPFGQEQPKFFRNGVHQAYGFVYDGTIYIDPRIATAETPLHEYTHLWAEVLRQRNPQEWQNIVQMMKDTPEVWNYVKQNYPHLNTDDEIADEALAQFSGKRGYQKLQDFVDGKQDADTIFDKIMEALQNFWYGVAEFFGIHYTSKEEVADRILYDLLNEVNPLDFKIEDIEGLREEQEQQRRQSQSSVVPRRLTPQDREAGGALVDHLEKMGITVHTDNRENRRILKAAEKDQSEAGKVRYFKTEQGESYGFAYKGEIHLDLRKLDAELPLHEYAHLFCQAMQRINPDNWNHVVGLLKQDAETWDAVKRIYPELATDSEVAEEVIAQYSGKRGAEKLQAELERMTPRDANYGSRWGNIYQNVAKAIQDFWKHIGDSMNIEYSSKEDIADQILNDFAKNVNPVKKMERWLEERDKDYAAAVAAGDFDKARDLFWEALHENVGNGITPFMAVDGYRGKLDQLAHAVKEVDNTDAINKAADLMAPFVREDMVLVPAPGHEGYASSTLALANAIAERTAVPVADVLKSDPRESQYEYKYAHDGKAMSADALGIRLEGDLPADRLPVVIDNVVHTGNTAEACIKALGGGVVLALASAVSQEKHVASLKSLQPVVYDKEDNLIPLSERFVLKNKWLGRVMNYKPLDGDVQQPVVKEPDVIQGLEGYSVDDVKSYVENSINEILEDAGLSDEITIKNITVVGSRSRGEAHEDSDLDILVEYEGNFREDALFDILHEEGLDLEGITIDINPINPHYSLTTEQWLARDAEWREEDRQKNAALSAEKDNNESINIRSMQTSVIKSNLQVLADRLLPGTQSRVRFLKPQDPDRPSAVGGEIYRREDGIHLFRENKDIPLSSLDDHEELADVYRSLLEYSIAERIGNGNGMNFPDHPNVDGYEISVAAVADGNLHVMGTRDGEQANNSFFISMEGLEELLGIIDKRVAEVENIRDFDAVALHENNYQAFALAASALMSKVTEPNTLYDNIIAIGDMPPTVEHLEEWASEQMDLLRRGDADSVRVNELSNGKYRKFLSAVSANLPEEDVKRLIDGIAAQRNTYSENHIIDQYDKVISHYQIHAPEGALADDVVNLLAAKDGVALMNWVRDSHDHDYSEPLQQLKAMLSTKTVYQADQITAAIQERDLQVDHRAQVERSLPKTPIEQSYAFVMSYYMNNVLKMSEDEKTLFKGLDNAHSVEAYQRWASDVRVGGALQGLSDMPDAVRADIQALAYQISETKDDVLKDEIIDALDGIGIVNQFRKVALAQQYEALKAQYPDDTILFRNGQAFSAYGDDVDAIQGQTGWYGQTVGEKGQQFRWMNISHDGYNVLADKEINLRVVTPNVNIRPLAALFDEKMGAAMQTIDYSLSLGGDKPVLVDTDGSLVISEKDSDFKVKTLDFHTTGLTAISDEGKELVVRDIPKNYYHPQATLVVADYINGHRQTIEHPLEASQPVSAEMQAKQTQLLVSYKDIKAAHENEVVLFRQKGFFEAFGQDADKVAEKFGVPVYERNLGGEDVHFVMIPTEKYASALEDGIDLDLFIATAQVAESRRDIRSTVSFNEQIAVEHGREKLGVSVTPIDNEGHYQIAVFNPDTRLAYDDPMELSEEDAEKFRSLEGVEHLSERSDLIMAFADKYFNKELELNAARNQVVSAYDNMGMSYTPLMLLHTIDFKPNQTAEVEHYNAVSVDSPYIMLYETMRDAEKSMSPRMLTDLSADLQKSVLDQLKGGMFNEMRQEVAEYFEQPQEQHINIDDQLERVGQLTKELGLEYVPFSTRLPITVPADTEVDWREEDKVFTEVMCNGDNVTIYQNHQDSYDDNNGVDLYDLPKDLQKAVLDLMEEKLTDGDRQMTVYVDTARVPEYAVGAIVNGDNTGLTDESIEMVREFTSQYPNHIFSVRDDSTSFNSNPAFGKATDCVDVDIVRIATPKQLRQEVLDKQAEKLQQRYNEFVKEHGEQPLYAEVTIRFKDDNVQEVAMIKLSEEIDPSTDNKIFFNVNNFEGLKDLLKVDNGEDFDVINVEETQFYDKSLYQPQEQGLSDSLSAEEMKHLERHLMNVKNALSASDTSKSLLAHMLTGILLDGNVKDPQNVREYFKNLFQDLNKEDKKALREQWDAIEGLAGGSLRELAWATAYKMSDAQIGMIISGQQEDKVFRLSYGDDPTGVIKGDIHVQFTKELAYVSFEDFKALAEDLGGSVRMMNNERWADFYHEDDAIKFADTVVDVNVSRMEAAREGAKEQPTVAESQDRESLLAEVTEKISQTENKEYSPEDVAVLKEAAIAHIEKYNSDYYQSKDVDIKGMIEGSEITDRHSLADAVSSIIFDIHSEAIGREAGIMDRLLPVGTTRSDEMLSVSLAASDSAEAILDNRQNNLKEALESKVSEVNTTLTEYNRLSQASDSNFILSNHVESYALEQKSDNEFALTDAGEGKFITSWLGAREMLAHLVSLLQKMFEKFPELNPSHGTTEEKPIVEKTDVQKKSSKWDTIDYTKYVLPEGCDVKNMRWKFIKPKDGEQYGKYHIMCDFKGEHYEREMYGNDIKAFFEKDDNGQRTNRVTLDQLVAKYFGKQFAESMSIGSVQEAEHVRAEQEDAKDQAVNDKKQQAQQQADKEKEAAQQKAAEEKKAAEVAAKKKAEEEQKSEKKVKVPAIILQSTLLIDALLAAKAADGVWLNKEVKGAPILYQAGTPSVSAFNGLMMALHSDAHGYKSNDYTTFNVAKGDGYHVKGGENGLPFNWYKWDKYVNRFNANEVIDKAAYDALAPEEKELYKVQRIKEERSIFNIDQTTMPEVKKEAYNFILESQDKDSVYRGAEESSVQPFSLPKQFVDLKEKHPEAILLMRDGNSYNIYGEDADKLSGLLGLDVKDHDPEGNEIKFAAFPHHALDINLPKIIRSGARVAICDQIGDIRSSQRGAADAIYNKAVGLEDALVKLSGDTNKVMKEPFFDTCYDSNDDTLRFADRRYSRPGNEIVTALQRVNDSFRAAAAYTGGESRLNRVAYSTMLPADAEKYDRLVSELAAGVLMSRAGLPATLSKESMALVPYWVRELKESPKLMESVERDVNNAVEVLEKIKAGETVDYGAIRGEKAFDAIRPKLYTIANELATIPDAEAKIVVVVKDQQKKSAAVILPAGASLEVNNEIPGLNKNRFLIALRKQGFENVQFYNAGGALGLNQSNDFFADKTVEIAKLKQYDLNVVENIDLSEEIERSLKVDLKQVQVTFDDNMRPLLYVKPVDGESFTVYPEPSDVKLFFDNVRSPEFDAIRETLGQKYYGLVSRHPDLKTDVLMPKVSSDIDLSRISKVNITKDRYKPESTIIFATIDGQQQKPIELNQIEAQRYWLVDDKNLYKLLLAAQHFEEQLNNTNGQSEDGQNQFHDCHEGSGVGSSSSSAEVSTDGQEDKQERKGGIRM